MKTQFIIFLAIFFSVYGSINYYIGLRGRQAFGILIPAGYGKYYWSFFSFLALSFIAGRLGEKYLPVSISDGLIVIGSFWLAAMHFLFFFLVMIDMIGFLDRRLGLLPMGMKKFPALKVLAVVLSVAGIVIYGSWNSRNPRLVHYEVAIPKKAGDLNQMRVIMVSDIHLGRFVHNGRLVALIQGINNLAPDLVLLPGDIIDENIGHFVDQKMPDSLNLLKSKYGIFGVFGNHEYIGGHAEEAFRLLQEAGVTVLRDSCREIAGSFYLVGRDDRARERFGGAPRQELSVIMEGLDRSLPIILMDHQPFDLEEGRRQGVDLQLSGHTHLGQLFPFNFITQKLFETDWGYLRKGDFQVIVSCGFGTWGPPVRIGNVPEIVDIVINFTDPPGQNAHIPQPCVKIADRL